jgi:hypothetical protein
MAASAVAILGVMTAGNADAYELKHTPSGLIVRWPLAHVEYVVDSTLDQHVAGATAAVDSAVQSWSGVAGAPSTSSKSGSVGTAPMMDQQNSVLYLHGFAAAEGALAVTVVSFDASTGFIMDADVVINADHEFAVLPANTRAPSDSPLVSTEGNHGQSDTDTFDLPHVVAHEVGHSLGLGDESSDPDALMFPYTKVDDASVRAPGSDDVTGLDQEYAGANLESGSAGCGGSSVAGRRVADSSWSVFLLMIGAGGWLVSRRRRMALVPVSIALLSVVIGIGEARSAPVSLADITGRVTSVKTEVVSGVFQTTLEVAPSSCRAGACPSGAVAHVWGGTMGGITQIVGGAPIPAVDDEVDLALGAASAERAAPSATVIAVRPSASRIGLLPALAAPATRAAR